MTDDPAIGFLGEQDFGRGLVEVPAHPVDEPVHRVHRCAPLLPDHLDERLAHAGRDQRHLVVVGWIERADVSG